MSKSFEIPPRSFVKHDGLIFEATHNTARADGSAGTAIKQDDANTVDPRIAAFLLKDDHLVLRAIDGLLALHASFKAKFTTRYTTRYKTWRGRRRTLKALADLDERQLRDIGLSREDTLSAGSARWAHRHASYRALAELDASELCHLSEHGVQAWHAMHRSRRQSR
jgi:uncharacterized protein YjiS (DUF1127 family)